jgi:hypothetical protein
MTHQLAAAAAGAGAWPLALALVSLALGFLDFGSIIGAIWGAIKWAADKAVIIATAVARAVKSAAVFTWHGLRWLALRVRDASLWIRDRVVDLYDHLIKPAVQAVVRALDKVEAFLKRVLGPFLRFVERVQHALKWVYDEILRPLLRAIEIARLIARGLAALGVGWASRVDQYLANLENRLVQAFTTVLQYVNLVSDWLGVILDSAGLIKKELWYHSLVRSRIEFYAFWINYQIRSNPIPTATLLAAKFTQPPLDLSLGNMRGRVLQRPPEFRAQMADLRKVALTRARFIR